MVKNKIILTVDDNITNQFLVVHILEKSGYRVLQAFNGRQAIQLYKKNPQIVLILMDLLMPVIDGFKATGLIRKMEKKRNLKMVPIIFVSASKSIAKKEVDSYGANDFIQKPIGMKELLDVISQYVENGF